MDVRPYLEPRPEEGLDPDDWDALRALAHRMVDDVVDFHASVGGRPAWQPVPPEARAEIGREPPAEGVGAEAAYERFRRLVQPYPFGNVHPRAWGWVNGTGTTLGALAEMLGAAMNPNAWGGEQSAAYVEAEVIEWARRAFGFPAEATGLLVSGGSMANFVALAAAREARGGPAVSESGVHALDAQLVVYASEQTHNSVDKAVGLLGIGWRGLRKIPTDAQYRVDLAELEAAVAEDRAAGRRPVAVVGNAGTVNSGAIDDLEGLADFCAEQGLWLHVDGAFGAMAALSPALRPLVAGLERADSLAFDLHKWMYVPIEAGCVLVRDAEAHRRPFSPGAAYLAMGDRGPASGPANYSMLGMQLTRGFRALKVWMSLQAHGTDVYGRLVEQNVRQARALEERVRAHLRLELMAPVPLNVVCFRYRTPGLDAAALDAFNRELLARVQESGAAVPSSTVIGGGFAMRVAITNHRTRLPDLDLLVEAVARLGDGMAAEWGAECASA
ncbi:MAG TPA: pyridoxal-dependent decarboxylase [Longimicrobium sp.]|jgi:glutamate/tyrosine decarboxylase-like PLP-dependent enzyme